MRDPLDGMVGQQLEDADILPGAGAETEPLFEVAVQVGERWRQVPIAVDRGVVQGRRFALQNHQKMQGIEHFFAVAIAASVRCHLLPVGDHDDALDVPFHRHRGRRTAAGRCNCCCRSAPSGTYRLEPTGARKHRRGGPARAAPRRDRAGDARRLTPCCHHRSAAALPDNTAGGGCSARRGPSPAAPAWPTAVPDPSRDPRPVASRSASPADKTSA